MPEQTHPTTRELLAALKADDRFEDPGHARRFICQDEMEDCPNLLTLKYRGAQFFARARGANIEFEIPNDKTVATSTMGDLDGICLGLDQVVTTDIVVSKYGDALCFDPGIDEATATLTWSDCGNHAVCGGACDHNEISATHQAIACRKCNLRVVFPIGIKTVADLRIYAGWTWQGKTNAELEGVG